MGHQSYAVGCRPYGRAGRSRSAGFTLIELITSMAVMSILLLALSVFITNATQNISNEDTKTALSDNTRTALESVAREIRAAKSVEAVNSQPDANAPGAPGNLYSWTASAGSGATLILAVPARDTSGNLIYSDGLHNNLYTDDIVYYLDGTSHRLYRRVIANTQAPGNAAKTTCPPDLATASCPADARIVDDVANLTTAYFDSYDHSVATPSGTQAVQITLTQTRSVFSHSFSNSYTTTASLRNR